MTPTENRKTLANHPKTLVTGGSGFVGRAVVLELLAQKRAVRVLARDPRHPALEGLPVDRKSVV